MGNLAEAEAGVIFEGVRKIYSPYPFWLSLMMKTPIKEEVRALDGVSFTVAPGEICAVVGPNGAGKTTAFQILVGMITPSEGRATVMGLDASLESLACRRLIGWAPSDTRNLLMRLTSRENLRFHGRLHGFKGRELEGMILDALAKVELRDAAETVVSALSAGMRARLQLARALLHRPPVLILDEPTGAIDPVAAHRLLSLLVGLVEEERLTALISSHRLEEIQALRSRVILLDEGKARYDGDLDDLRQQWDHPVLDITFRTSGSAATALMLLSDVGLKDRVVASDGSLQCPISDEGAGLVLEALSPVIGDIAEINERRIELRDLLAALYSGAQPAKRQGSTE